MGRKATTIGMSKFLKIVSDNIDSKIDRKHLQAIVFYFFESLFEEIKEHGHFTINNFLKLKKSELTGYLFNSDSVTKSRKTVVVIRAKLLNKFTNFVRSHLKTSEIIERYKKEIGDE